MCYTPVVPIYKIKLLGIAFAFGLLLLLPERACAQVQTSTEEASATPSVYTVVRGDTLWDIATRFCGNGPRWKDLASLNNLANPRIIHAGNKIALQSCEVTTKENLISNPGFEENFLGQIENWGSVGIVELNRWYAAQKTIEGAGKISAKRVKLDEENHNYAIKSIDSAVCSNFCSQDVVQLVPAREHTSYTLSADAKVTRGNGGTLYLDFLNAYRSRIDVKTKGGYLLGSWSRQSVTAQSPKGTIYIRVILYSSNDASGVILWDNIKLTENF